MIDQKSYFDEVYRSVYRDLLRYAILHMDRPADAEDALQIVFTAFYRRISRFGHLDILMPKAYLLRMLKREIARLHGIQTQEKLTVSLEEGMELEDPEVPIEDIAIDRNMTQSVLGAARQLPAQSYRTFVLYYGYGLSVTEIAEELHVGKDAVKVRLFRARNHIRRQLLMEEEKQ